MKPALILIALVVTLLFLPFLVAIFSDPPENLFAQTTIHEMGGALHEPDTLADINTRITDATLDDASDPRTPSAHTIVSHSDTTATGAELNELTDASETTLHSHAVGAGMSQNVWETVSHTSGTSTFPTSIGDTPLAAIGDASTDGSAFISIRFPANFDTLTRIIVVTESSNTGNLRYSVQTDWSGDGETINLNNGSIAATTLAVVTNTLYYIDISAAVGAVEADDQLGIKFTRLGTDGLDTISDFAVLGVIVEYVS
jgi:hypothetical protein